MSDCDCEVCQRHKKIRQLILDKDTDGLIEKIEVISALLDNVETDCEHYKMILNGTWPHSIEYLEKALENAKRIKNENHK